MLVVDNLYLLYYAGGCLMNSNKKPVYNVNYKKLLIDNQAEFIASFQSGIFGKLKHLFLQNKDNKCDAENMFSNNKTTIKKINDFKLMRNVQSLKSQLNKKKYLYSHFTVKKLINIITKTKMEYVYLSVACIIKNEGRYIKEWIDFHIAAGVERFFLFDNESDDNTYDILLPYIRSGKVIYIPFPGKKVQMIAYNIACDICKETSRWLAFIDADEFLHPVKSECLKTVLIDYESYAGIGVNWIVYGTCGNKTMVEGTLCENYRYTFEDRNNELNCRIKSIVNPRAVLAVMSPHHCWYKNGKYAVDENKEQIVGEALYAKNCSMSCTMFNSCNVLRINHYWTKSEEELKIKCQRGYPDGHANPVYESIMERLNYPLVEDYMTVVPFIKKSDRKMCLEDKHE